MNQFERWQVTRFLRGLAKTLVLWPIMVITAIPAMAFHFCQVLCNKLDDWWM